MTDPTPNRFDKLDVDLYVIELTLAGVVGLLKKKCLIADPEIEQMFGSIRAYIADASDKSSPILESAEAEVENSLRRMEDLFKATE